MAGNAVVLKPSEQASLSATLLGEIAAKVLPPGVLNVVTGDGAVGNALVRHPRVKRLSFVGSQDGDGHPALCCGSGGEVDLARVGGKNPFIVFPDAPLERSPTRPCSA